MKLDNKTYGLGISSLISIIFLIITFSNSTGLIQERYYEIFYYVFLTGTIFSWIIVAVLENNKTTDKVFYFNEARPKFPFFNNLLTRLGVMVGLSLIFIAGLNLGLTFIDVPQPFIQQSFAVMSEGSQLFYKFIFQALVPGVGEEFSIFVLVCLISFLLVAIGLYKTQGQLLINYILSSGIGSGILTLAHREAYGSDGAAYVGIFLFEWIVQFFNLLTGMFISWVPHIVHNYAIVFILATGFSIGGVPVAMGLKNIVFSLKIKSFKVAKK